MDVLFKFNLRPTSFRLRIRKWLHPRSHMITKWGTIARTDVVQFLSSLFCSGCHPTQSFLGPLHKILARLPGMKLLSVHLKNFSPVSEMKIGDPIIQAWKLTNKTFSIFFVQPSLNLTLLSNKTIPSVIIDEKRSRNSVIIVSFPCTR